MDEGIKVREVGRPLLPGIRPLSFKYWGSIEDIWSGEYRIKESFGKLSSVGYAEGRN